jgi:hypothetical protein
MSTRASWGGVFVLAATLAWVPVAVAQPWTQGNEPSLLSKVNRTLPGLRTGVLTTAKDGTVRIDSFQYQLASGALIVDPQENPVPLLEYVWDGVEIPAHYWLGRGAKDKQVIQMILTFAE